MFVICLVLAVQLIFMTIARSGHWKSQVQARLTIKRFIPTVRGRILDRRGRILAEDRPAYDVAVHYDLLCGRWAYRMAYKQAKQDHQSAWYDISTDERERFISEHLPTYQNQVNQMFQVLARLGKLTPEELEQRKATVLAKVAKLKTILWSYWRKKAIKDTEQPVKLSEVALPIAEERSHHPILRAITGPVRLQIEQILTEVLMEESDSVWKKVRLVDSTTRAYPLDTFLLEVDRSTFPSPLRGPIQSVAQITINGLGTHLIGTTRRIWAKDKAPKRRPFIRKRMNEHTIIDYGGYQLGDRLGAWGIERSRENTLRGSRGERWLNRETGEVQTREPIPGQDVVLSLDIQLQARIAALMSRDPNIGLMRQQFWHRADIDPADLGRPLNGAVVVLDVHSGEVLAAVSTPSYSRQDLKDKPSSFWTSDWAMINRPQIFRPLAMAYPPGSTIKPIALASAYTAGLIRHGDAIVCKGALDMSRPRRNRCWIFKHNMVGHGPMVGHEAICVSCNVFFYTLGKRFGLEKQNLWYRRLGLGEKTNCGLTPEHRGQLPDMTKPLSPRSQKLGLQDAIQMGIGQGPVEWTPIQAAGAYAALARGGNLISPTLLFNTDIASRQTKFKLDPKGVQLVLQGMYESVHSRRGTSHHLTKLDHELIFNIPDVRIMGKSGTATAGARWIDASYGNAKPDGKIQPHEVNKEPGDHAWFICIVQRRGSTTPDFVIVVVAEYAGSGGAVSGPIANQILWAMRQEGYL